MTAGYDAGRRCDRKEQGRPLRNGDGHGRKNTAANLPIFIGRFAAV
jgi:hypothetical protein